jgi:nitrite reductase/ring-hydroxylating ferredoxin subunit
MTAKHRTCVFLCKESDAPAQGIRRIELQNRPALALYRIDGELFATDDRCTHAGALLSEGEIEGDTVICPAHSGRFHIPSGRATCFPARKNLMTHPVRIANGSVYADIGDAEKPAP